MAWTRQARRLDTNYHNQASNYTKLTKPKDNMNRSILIVFIHCIHTCLQHLDHTSDELQLIV
jgi:hypothetical protein